MEKVDYLNRNYCWKIRHWFFMQYNMKKYLKEKKI